MSKSAAGFTLLEVIIALSLVSIIGIFGVHQVGQSQVQLAQTKWRDEISSEARSILIDLVNSPSKNIVRQGTLKPKFPHIEYSSRVDNVDDTGLKKLTIVFIENIPGKKRAEAFQLEYYLP